MSLLQASKKYRVPSWTLFDKLKKIGIMMAKKGKKLQQKNNEDEILAAIEEIKSGMSINKHH